MTDIAPSSDNPRSTAPSTTAPLPDHPDLWAGLRAPTRGYPVAPPSLPHLARWSEPWRGRVRSAQRRGEIVTLRRGRYLPASESQRDPELAAIAAVAARLTTPFALSHTSAARLGGLWVPPWDGSIHVSQQSKPSGRTSTAGLRRHQRRLDPELLRLRSGVVVTSVELTAVDCACTLPCPRALPIVDSALLIGADPAVMARLLDERAGQRGVNGARDTVGMATARIGSPAESRVRARIVMDGLPVPETLLLVETDAGLAEVDLGWSERRVAIEVHGRGKYADGADPAAEAIRRQALFDAGWRVVDVRTGESPARYLPRIRRAYLLGGVTT